MLIQSWGGELILLPALPTAWPSGSLKGVRARGGLIVDLNWHDANLIGLVVKGAAGSAVRIRSGGKARDVTLDSKGFYRFGA
jgi:alpha-L-fucosidase 2